MHHFMIDGFRGYRSRFDDIKLVQEVLEECPAQAGLQPVMPSFLLPYYNGVVPEDCGVSAFVFLRGGHMTIHTFSFRECYFADVLSIVPFDAHNLESLLQSALPCSSVVVRSADRHGNGRAFGEVPADRANDFGPHVLMEVSDYRGPRTMDAIFLLMDQLPRRVGMTPIMRPYVLRETTDGRGPVVSAMTMIAESHVSLHVLESEARAIFDIFSCSFFDYEPVMHTIRRDLPGTVVQEMLTTRGKGYKHLRRDREEQQERAKLWLRDRG
jgi:S-adenosylmethionine/arginine decarboxylase-like enzyme